ncbi:aminotransferase class V-fold PLP-dependent enzyme [Ohtaekwangia sp.]|uniref:aminotransferase class V-fold PLP-dependent enzyme n=1 Tax=Ohtaekwangia sp. TaxID=2066019 RepID=UPI002FDE927D
MQSQRSQFDIPEDIAYFNCAYGAPLLRASQQRIVAGIARKSYPWKTVPSDFFDDAETIRTLASELLGGDADGYAVVPSASYGISTAARALEHQLQKGDRILVMAEEFPSNVLPWKRIAFERQATVHTVPTPTSGNWTQAIIDELSLHVKIVALSNCHWTNGTYIDLIKIREACNHYRCTLVVDATQSLGAMPFALEQVKPDFLVAAGYKWLLFPYGVGLLYVAEPWRHARPLEESWLARQGAEDFASLVKYSDTYMPGARRFDVGEKCVSTTLPGAIAALEQIKAWGIDTIVQSLQAINDRLATHLAERGFRVPDRAYRCPHMFGAVVPPGYTGNLVTELKKKNIFISQRGNAVRFSPHVYNDNNDVQRLLEAIEEIIK